MDVEFLNRSCQLCVSFLLIMYVSQDASNTNAPQKEEQEVKDTSPDEENRGARDQKEENQDDVQLGNEGQVQQKVTVSEEEMHQEAYEQQQHQLSQVPGTENEPDQEVPVHQGQPEI